ncbi:hypothetical protein KFE25_003331 [Diacronema lutheri]|uniref:Nucleoside-diphosphate sugar epimerase n=1 Tax=Diacronema lutheri TaxID=2081491 RepID=A0A8J5XCS7_DIALT|nr:hypothetical protein KFE25_003331 [Diacronema lutheri]
MEIAVLSNGVVGAEKQAIALARASGRAFRVLRIVPHPLLARAPTSAQLLVARIGGVRASLFDQRCGDVEALFARPLPAFAVSCGRASILASVCLRALGAGALRTVHIQHPRCDLSEFDRVVLPRHDIAHARVGAGWGRAFGWADGARAHVPCNALVTTGSLHAIDDAALAAARAGAAPGSGDTQPPSPRVALLLGGPTVAAPYSVEAAARVLHGVHDSVRAAGGSLMVTTSRRSPHTLARAVAELASVDPAVCAWGVADGRANPYLAFLACAEHLIVTADSVNMVTEACAAAHFTGASVHVALGDACASSRACALRARGATRRLRSFVGSLFDGAAALPLRSDGRLAFDGAAAASVGRSAGDGEALRREIALQPMRIARAAFGVVDD